MAQHGLVGGAMQAEDRALGVLVELVPELVDPCDWPRLVRAGAGLPQLAPEQPLGGGAHGQLTDGSHAPQASRSWAAGALVERERVDEDDALDAAWGAQGERQADDCAPFVADESYRGDLEVIEQLV